MRTYKRDGDKERTKMGKIFTVVLLNWIVIAIAMFAIQPIPTYGKGLDLKKAYNDLLGSKSLNKEEVLARLRLIKSDSRYAEKFKTNYNRFTIAELINFGEFGVADCKFAIMKNFKEDADKARGSSKTVDKYVVNMFSAQMNTCRDYAIEVVDKFIEAYRPLWEQFQKLYASMKSYGWTSAFSKPSSFQILTKAADHGQHLINLQRQGKLERKVGSPVYQAVADVQRNCKLFANNQLNDLLRIQIELNSKYKDDTDLLKCMTYMNLCQGVNIIENWGTRFADNLIEEVIPGWTVSYHKVSTGLDADNNYAVVGAKGYEFAESQPSVFGNKHFLDAWDNTGRYVEHEW